MSCVFFNKSVDHDIQEKAKEVNPYENERNVAEASTKDEEERDSTYMVLFQ